MSDAATQAFVHYLNRNGWQARIAKPGAASNGTDLRIAGHLLTLSLDANSRVGPTKLNTATKIAIYALNGTDGSMVRRTLNGAGSDTVFWFEPDDARPLVAPYWKRVVPVYSNAPEWRERFSDCASERADQQAQQEESHGDKTDETKGQRKEIEEENGRRKKEGQTVRQRKMKECQCMPIS